MQFYENIICKYSQIHLETFNVNKLINKNVL